MGVHEAESYFLFVFRFASAGRNSTREACRKCAHSKKGNFPTPTRENVPMTDHENDCRYHRWAFVHYSSIAFSRIFIFVLVSLFLAFPLFLFLILLPFLVSFLSQRCLFFVRPHTFCPFFSNFRLRSPVLVFLFFLSSTLTSTPLFLLLSHTTSHLGCLPFSGPRNDAHVPERRNHSGEFWVFFSLIFWLLYVVGSVFSVCARVSSLLTCCRRALCSIFILYLCVRSCGCFCLLFAVAVFKVIVSIWQVQKN